MAHRSRGLVRKPSSKDSALLLRDSINTGSPGDPQEVTASAQNRVTPHSWVWPFLQHQTSKEFKNHTVSFLRKTAWEV